MEQIPLDDEETFDLRHVQKYFNECLENNLDLQAYINGYIELNKYNFVWTLFFLKFNCVTACFFLFRLFTKLGGLFKFIVHDVTEKTQILGQHLKTPAKDNYEKIESMLDYEQKNDLLLDPAKQPAHHLANGARTLLRLHRALLFVVKLIDGVKNSDENDRMAPLAKTAYDSTLGHFHPWLIRKGVHLAVYTLPYRKQVKLSLVSSITFNSVRIHVAGLQRLRTRG